MSTMLTTLPTDDRTRMLRRGAIVVLLILYAVGMVSVLVGRTEVLALTPLNLLISTALALSFHRGSRLRLVLFVAVCYVVGFGVELAGINTGRVFGEYTYGSVLGYKWYGTPWMIGVNWAMLSYICGVAAGWLLPGKSVWLRSAIGAAIMVGLDLFMEPVAMTYDFWDWALGYVPLQNYIAWFGIAYVLQLLYHRYLTPQRNLVAVVLLALQFIFFAGLLLGL